MNPELIKIALENKTILDSLKSQIDIQQITPSTATNKSLNYSVLWTIAFFAGVVIVGYNVYSYYNDKKCSTN